MDTTTAPPQRQTNTSRALRWFSPRWRKVVRDLWENKLRTLLVVLSISVGVFAVGMISGTQNILMGALDRAYAESNPSHATLISFTTFDQNLVDSIADMPEVATAEARGAVFVRLQTGPDEWQLAQLTIIPDFDDIQLDEVRPESGKWPPEKGEILIERSALGLTQAEVGDTLHLKTPSGKERDVQFVGLAYDMYAMLYVIDGLAYGY
ncbi:MAG: hypothetical protein KDD89_16665, partial [Anaerolineales bacterium]|nr:hypothetical protein [Anaerolineales bacterium]